MLGNSRPNQIFCILRKKWVNALPEELIRQRFIQLMTQQWGYPLSGLLLEKKLCHLPHLKHFPLKLPRRRTDLVLFAKDIHPQHALYPLLLIECKAVPFTPKVIRQVMGYNFYVKAHFMGIVNQEEIRLGWYDQTLQDFCFIPAMLSYQQLLLKWKALADNNC